ncbi:FAD-binding oxidoreductase [Agaribacterium sp. ZY112]|uniref:FAD-binding oxidoreductase n=1 Tax=Agaribacterium sp. ZY112 TaxID=3233574 RepID=UPI003525929C
MKVKLKTGERFECLENTVLEAALGAGLRLPFSCRRGECDSCECTLIEGSVSQNGVVICAGERIKTCEARPEGDCVIDAEHLPQLTNVKRIVTPAKVSQIEIVEDTAVLRLRTPPAIFVSFLEGQYLDLLFSGIRRSYSIASTSGSDLIELHIKRVAGGAMSGNVFDVFAENTLVRLELPIGSFFVRESDKPLIFLATGTGFSSVQSMVSRLLDQKTNREVHVYWGNRYQKDFYTDLPREWAGRHKNVIYCPVTSREKVGSSCRYVQEAALKDIGAFNNYDVYACGSLNMIESAKKLMIENGLQANNFYSDAFVATTN